MPGVTKEQIRRAKGWDLLSYLQTYEPGELRKAGTEYYTAGHDSLKISNGVWHWHSRGIGGKTALDYLIKVRGMDFVTAVGALCSEKMPVLDKEYKRKEPEPEEAARPGKFYLPEGDRIGAAVVSYLQKRGIDGDIINQCIRLGLLYESREHHNCVFVGYDLRERPRYACLRGTGSGFKGEIAGSSKDYGFYLPAREKDSPFVAVAESPIDALSAASLLKMQGEEWERNYYLSLGCTAPRALLQFMRDHPAVTDVSLCLDNDEAGRIGMEKIRAAVREDKEISGRIRLIADNPPPVILGKDYNELLQRKVEGMRKEREKEKVLGNGR